MKRRSIFDSEPASFRDSADLAGDDAFDELTAWLIRTTKDEAVTESEDRLTAGSGNLYRV